MPDQGWLIGGRYRVLGRLGVGGMAEVFRAHDESLDRDVAVKVFRRGVDDQDDASVGARRALELQALARLNHPNLITLYDGSMAGEPSYLVMELIDGEDLSVRLRKGPLSAGATREMGAQIASALDYVHGQGLVHRDVKPANILLGTDGRARLSDFGVVRLVGSPRMTSAALTMGTASYLAPEQARGGDVHPPADVYALGLVLIESLTGVRSFDGPVLEAMAARLARPPHIPADLPAPWPQLLASMTALDPAARPSAAQVGQVLRGASPSATAPTAAFGAGPRTGATTAIPRAAAAGSTTAMPQLPPLPVRPRAAGSAGARVAAAQPARRSPWSIASIVLAVALLLAIAVVVVVALVTNGSGSGDHSTSPSPSTSSSPSRTPSTSHSAPSTPRTTSRPPSTSSAPSTTSPPSSPSSTPSTPSSPPPTSASSTPSSPVTTPSSPAGTTITVGPSLGASSG